MRTPTGRRAQTHTGLHEQQLVEVLPRAVFWHKELLDFKDGRVGTRYLARRALARDLEKSSCGCGVHQFWRPKHQGFNACTLEDTIDPSFLTKA